jgi:hypothetical protein
MAEEKTDIKEIDRIKIVLDGYNITTAEELLGLLSSLDIMLAREKMAKLLQKRQYDNEKKDIGGTSRGNK